jgi:uncharacterized membrane protein
MADDHFPGTLMRRLFLAWLAIVVTLLLLDLIWLGLLAMPLYQQGIGHLMAGQPQLWAGGLFYLLHASGLILFVVRPALASGRPAWPTGALFGLCCYGTYDLSNLATLRDWPVWLAGLDMAWGSLISAAAASAAVMAADRPSADRTGNGTGLRP